MSMFSAHRGAGRILLGLLAWLACATLSVPVAAQPETLEIPSEEFEAFEPDVEGYKPNPLLMSRHPLGSFFIFGVSPCAFADAVWEMEVTGGWTQSLSGRGTIHVNTSPRAWARPG